VEPKKQECIGLYLYGAGYYAREDNTLGLVTGNAGEQPHFCLTCPRRADCETKHEQRVRRLMPAQVEAFDRIMREAVRRDVGPTMVAALLAKQGRDPFAATAVENFSRGHADRGREAGTLVQ
jgi:hypothetical protein